MRRSLPLAMLLVGSLAASARAQVLIEESLTRATLVQERTTVSLTFNNTLQKPVEALVQLQWLDPMDRIAVSLSHSSHLEPGKSLLTFPFSLPATKADARLLRLRYSVVPGARNLSDFGPLAGVLSLVHTAPYAFSLQILGAPEAHRTPNQPGLTIDLYTLATHPATHQPIPNVHIEARGSMATTDKNGLAILHVRLPDDYGGDEIPLSARLGDFTQTMEVPGLEKPHDNIRIEIDKPLYQPGQILHVRTLALGSDGHACSGEKQKIRILDSDGNLAHTAAVTTSQYGIAWTDWTIPSNAKSGRYNIEVSSENLDDSVEREIEIRSYELPSFRVSARSTRPYYLPGETALLELGAAYLFGKPVPHARARIEPADSDKPAWSGVLNAAGNVQASLSLTGLSIPAGENFVDRTYTALVTDPSTNRTEQRKFDVRLSRTRLHLYIAYREATLQGERVYLSVYFPDGTPARAMVSASSGARCATNRFGLCEIDIPSSMDRVTLAAIAQGARSQSIEVRPYPPARLVLETDRSLYRRGESVHCRLAARDPATPVLLLAWNADHQVVFSQLVRPIGGRARLDIPFDARFGERLSLAAVAADAFAATEILFPGGTPFHVTIHPAKATYRPGEMAHIEFLASSQAALGLPRKEESRGNDSCDKCIP